MAKDDAERPDDERPDDDAVEPGGPRPRRVRRRRVIYVHGFDPAKSDRYRRLLLRAGSDRDGVTVTMGEVGPITERSEGWMISASGPDGQVETVFEILRYEDIVRHWRNRPAAERLVTGLTSWLRFAFLGGLGRAAALAKGPAALFFYPVVMLAVFIVLGIGCGGLAGRALEAWAGAPDWTTQAGRAVGAGLGLLLSLRAERALFVHLMLALFDFLIRVAEDKRPAGRLDGRISLFSERLADCVADAQAKKVDEILIVGHSLGALVGVRALADALERDVDLTGGRAQVALLTLGSVAGYVACHGGPGAEAYDAAVTRLASDHDLAWVDVSAPRDLFSFGLVDPLLMTEDPPTEARSPLVISAKFGRFRPDPDDKRTRFRAMGLHMRYLAAPDRDGGFDFFETVAGAKTLADRYAGRRHSPKAKVLHSTAAR